MCRHTDLFWIFGVNNYETPLSNHIFLDLFQSLFNSKMTFLTFLGQQLNNYLSVSFTGKDLTLQIGLSKFLIVDYSSVVDKKIVATSIKMWMSIRRGLATTSSPARMSDSNETTFMIINSCCNYFLNTVLFLFYRKLRNF